MGEHRPPAARPRVGGTRGYALGEWATSNASPGRSSSRRAATTSRPAPTSPSPLLFDSLVDAYLLINTRQNGGKPLQKMRVLVLTDYYPLKLLLGQMSVLIGPGVARTARKALGQARRRSPWNRGTRQSVDRKTRAKRHRGVQGNR